MTKYLPVDLRCSCPAASVGQGFRLDSALNLWAAVTCVIMGRALRRG